MQTPFQVLVVDDDLDAAESMAELLKMDGHSAEMVHIGRDALDAARRTQPDLILMDIGLPEMDGNQVATLLRHEASLDHTVLAALTGWGRAEDRRASLDAGFDVYLVKPVSLRELRELVARVRQQSQRG